MGLLVLLLLAGVVAALVFGVWMVVAIISAIASALVAVGGHLLPVLMILVGAWLVWRALFDNGRHHERPTGHFQHQMHGQRRMHGWGPGAPPAPVAPGKPGRRSPRGEPARVPQTPASPPPLPRRELPIDVLVKAEQIQRKADILLGYADRFPPFSQSLHIVRQTAADYLPRTLEAYLALPGLTDPVVPTTGRTALAELRAQLQLLDAKLDDITLDLQQQDLDRMSANRRFLEERFGMGPVADASQFTDQTCEQSPTPERVRSGAPFSAAS